MEQGPLCPGCRYPIFGLRDMKCPECGRILDVRDFGIGGEDTAARRRKMNRDGILGGIIACVLLLVVLLPIVVLTGAFARYGFLPAGVLVLLVFCCVWFGRVFMSLGRDVMGSVKKKRK